MMIYRRMLLAAAMMAVSLAVGTTSARAATLTAGNCQNGAFATIQSAVDAANAGDTVAVCPGYYSEQLTIAKPLTVKGIAAVNQGAAVIVPPPEGLAADAADALTGDAEAAQILVQTPGQGGPIQVVLRNLTVDGLNSGIAGCSPSVVGILYQNASGTIGQVVARNQQLGAALAGCQSGYGLRVETTSDAAASTVAIQNSGIHGYQKNGITAVGVQTSVTIVGNSVRGQGPNSGAAENGIQVGPGASGSVKNNSISDHVSIGTGFAATGILIAGSANVQIAGNTIGNSDFGIAVETVTGGAIAGNADGAAIRNNAVFGSSYDGIDLCSNGDTAAGNTITDSAEAAVNLDASCGGSGNNNSIARNTINEGCAGILAGVGTAGNTVSPDIFLNVTNMLVNGSQCPDASLDLAKRPLARPRVL
jgi:hypothetical protein